jgi:outer membrane protein assembly factor BamB
MNFALFAHVTVCIGVLSASVIAQDWPQWRGANRDAKASGFKAPDQWPSGLKEKWKVTVGEGVATPALVGDRLYVFTRQEGAEVIRCLNAIDGKEIWQDRYECAGASGPSQGFSGPRSSPSVAGGKVVTYGVGGILSCTDAATGKKIWRKNPALKPPRFFTACSPLLSGNLCIIQLGGEENGAIAAYDVASGDEKWKWTGDGSAYASPAIMTIGGTPVLAALTAKKIVGLGLMDGKLAWELPFVAQGRAYNAATPIADGDKLMITGAGRGTRAWAIEKQGEDFSPKELWSNSEEAVQFNTPVLKDGLLYGITQNGDLFCVDERDGKTLWTSKVGGRGFGSVVDAGSVLIGLTPQGELIVFAAGRTEYKQLASYKVGSDTYAYPVLSKDGIFLKDKDSVMLLALE